MKILKIQTAPMELQCCHTHSATNSLLLWSIKQTVCRNTYIHSNATEGQTEQWKKGLLQKMFV